MMRWSARVVAGVAGLMLSGCMDGDGQDIKAVLATMAPPAVRVADGQVVLTGPRGYCVDPVSVRRSEDGAGFALLGSCASLANAKVAGSPRRRAVLSATVAPDGGFAVGQNTAAMLGFLQSDAGRATLSGTGAAEDVTVLQLRAEDGAVLVQARDAGLAPAGQFEPDYWRGFFDVNGRVVTVSVLSLTSRPLRASDGERLLGNVIAAIRAANPAQETVPDTSPRT